MEDPTHENLLALTEKFFSMHWNSEKIGQEPPSWSNRYTFSGSLPNYDKQGVYVFTNGNTITYIGVGASAGNGRYAGHGLGRRFKSYSNVVNGAHNPTDSRLIEAGSMFTIGFMTEQAYLATSLELYLIGRMRTKHNVNRPGASAIRKS